MLGLVLALVAVVFALPLLGPSSPKADTSSAPQERSGDASVAENPSAEDDADSGPVARSKLGLAEDARSPDSPSPSGERSGADNGAATEADGGSKPMVSAPVRLADPEVVRLLQPGDRVDVLASPVDAKASASARLVARRARVARLPGEDGKGVEGGRIADGGLLVLTVPPGTARAIAGAGAHSQLTVSLW